MKMPKTLKIGGHVVKVDYSQELGDSDGEFDIATNTIRICKTLAQSQKESTLFHEIMHVLNSELDSTRESHALIESLSQQLYQVFKDNKLMR